VDPLACSQLPLLPLLSLVVQPVSLVIQLSSLLALLSLFLLLESEVAETFLYRSTEDSVQHYCQLHSQEIHQPGLCIQ
jgi:hypothetical protein